MPVTHTLDGLSALAGNSKVRRMKDEDGEYKVCSGNPYRVRMDSATYFSPGLPDAIVSLLHLEYKRTKNRRLRIYYGDTDTGEAWGDVEVGYIGRSTGRKPVLLIVRKGALGGGAILTDSIVRIVKDWNDEILYEHPGFTEPGHGCGFHITN